MFTFSRTRTSYGISRRRHELRRQWRQASERVDAAYQSWSEARNHEERAAGYAAFRAALDQEATAANAYCSASDPRPWPTAA